MRRFIACAVLAVSLTGCAGWWQKFQDDPVTQTDIALGWANSALSVADVTMQQILGRLPAEKAKEARARYQAALVAVRHAEAALRNAVQAAADAKSDKPDLTVLISSLTKTVEEVVAVVDAFKNMHESPTEPGKFLVVSPPQGYNELKAQLTGLKRATRTP